MPPIGLATDNTEAIVTPDIGANCVAFRMVDTRALEPPAPPAEQLGGFVLIEARDLNEAIQIAGRIPSARIGSIEVRPVIDLRRERSAR